MKVEGIERRATMTFTRTFPNRPHLFVLAANVIAMEAHLKELVHCRRPEWLAAESGDYWANGGLNFDHEDMLDSGGPPQSQ